MADAMHQVATKASTSNTSKSSHAPHIRINGHRHHHSLHHSPKTLQSALLPTTAYGELLSPVKSIQGGIGITKSRRGSEGDAMARPDFRKRSSPDAAVVPARPKKEVTWADVNRERQRRREAEKELTTKLTNLSSIATTTTRRVDYTYYNLLSALPALGQALAQLQDLTKSASELLGKFTQESIPEMLQEHESQVSVLKGNLDTMRKAKLGDLEARMKKARERVTGLGDRVNAVRKRVEIWEMRENERLARRRKWWRVIWTMLAALIFLIIAVVIWRNWPQSSIDTFKQVAGPAPGDWPGGSSTAGYEPSKVPDRDDPLFRMFDEL